MKVLIHFTNWHKKTHDHLWFHCIRDIIMTRGKWLLPLKTNSVQREIFGSDDRLGGIHKLRWQDFLPSSPLRWQVYYIRLCSTVDIWGPLLHINTCQRSLWMTITSLLSTPRPTVHPPDRSWYVSITSPLKGGNGYETKIRAHLPATSTILHVYDFFRETFKRNNYFTWNDFKWKNLKVSRTEIFDNSPLQYVMPQSKNMTVLKFNFV